MPLYLGKRLHCTYKNDYYATVLEWLDITHYTQTLADW
jgi:hypothetical protein